VARLRLSSRATRNNKQERRAGQGAGRQKMEPKAALSAIRDFAASTAPASNAPDLSVGANVVSTPAVQPAEHDLAPPVDDGPQPGDLRLVIEQDDHSGEYIYKTVDRRTGETLQQFPREQILKLREETTYASGDVFDGQA
jgi:flagellar protein FlaG